ncbi:MAG: carbon storage regulator [Legionella sp.]|nr:MAG: carbon storage regulator [Legionella sp.]
MLVLTRKIGEKFLMGHDMNIKILGVKGKQVRIGIEAPESVNIVRAELLSRDPKSTRFWENSFLKGSNKDVAPLVNQ